MTKLNNNNYKSYQYIYIYKDTFYFDISNYLALSCFVQLLKSAVLRDIIQHTGRKSGINLKRHIYSVTWLYKTEYMNTAQKSGRFVITVNGSLYSIYGE
jgi:hypothetical protein